MWGKDFHMPPKHEIYKNNASAIAKWLHEREEQELINWLFRYNREAIDRLHRIIHFMSEEPQETHVPHPDPRP